MTTTDPDIAHDTAPSVLEAGWRYRRLVVTTAAVGLILGLLYAAVTTGGGTASARLVLSDPAGADLLFPPRAVTGDYERFVRSQARFATSDRVLEPVAADLDTSPDELRDDLSATAGTSGDVLAIDATASDGDRAVELVQAVVASYRQERRDVVASAAAARLDQLDEESRTLTGSTAAAVVEQGIDLRTAVDTYDDGVAFVQFLEVDQPSFLLGIVLPALGSTLLATMGALLAAWVLADRNPRVDRAEDVERRHGLTLIGRIPVHPPGTSTRDRAYDVVSLGLEHQLGLVDRAGERRPERPVALVTSVVARGGTSTTVDRTARAAADSGLRVCVVDATTHVGTSRRGEDVEDLDDVLERYVIAESAAGGEAVVVRPVDGANASFVGLRRHPAFTDYVDALRRDFDMVLIDCPALSVDSTALKLIAEADAVVLVVPHATSQALVDDAVRMLDNIAMATVGYVITLDPTITADSAWRGGSRS